MARLPAFLQHPLTWLTGMPLPNQRPLFRWTPWTRLLSGLGVTLGGLTAGAAGMASFAADHPALGLVLAPLAFLFTVGGLRALYLEIAHNAVHHAFTGVAWIDRTVTEALTLLTFTGGYDVFRGEHVRDHHAFTATPGDPDYRLLLSFGFRPGRSVDELLCRSWTAVFDPLLHARWFLARARAQLLDGPLSRRLLAIAWNATLLAIPFVTGAWLPFLVLWLLPLSWGFQVSALLQLLSEHDWGLDLPKGRERVLRLSHGRFLGEPFPERGRGGQLRWWARVVFLHLPARVAVFVGNDVGPAHDVHHLKPGFDWANGAYARRDMVRRGELGEVRDLWGSLPRMIRWSMWRLARSWRRD